MKKLLINLLFLLSGFNSASDLPGLINPTLMQIQPLSDQISLALPGAMAVVPPMVGFIISLPFRPFGSLVAGQKGADAITILAGAASYLAAGGYLAKCFVEKSKPIVGGLLYGINSYNAKVIDSKIEQFRQEYNTKDSRIKEYLMGKMSKNTSPNYVEGLEADKYDDKVSMDSLIEKRKKMINASKTALWTDALKDWAVPAALLGLFIRGTWLACTGGLEGLNNGS